MTQNERVKMLRKDPRINLTLEKFGERLGVQKGAISRIENNINSLTDQMIKAICREFGVNESWLRDGTGEMFTASPMSEIDILDEHFKLDPAERVFMERYFSLSREDRNHVVAFMEGMARDIQPVQEDEFQVDEAWQQGVRLIQYCQHLASAGTGEIVYNDLPADTIEIPDLPEYSKVSYAISVNGDSMEPRYSDGDILLVEPTCSIDRGEVGIFVVDGKAFVKKLGERSLISLNESYEDIPLTEDTKCMGRVVGKL